MANYSNVDGVGYSRYLGDNEEPETSQKDAHIEEMYVSNGRFVIRMVTDDGFLDISIPIMPKKSWGKLVESLPRWN